MDSERDSPLPSNIQTGGTPTHVDDVRVVLSWKKSIVQLKITDFKIKTKKF